MNTLPTAGNLRASTDKVLDKAHETQKQIAVNLIMEASKAGRYGAVIPFTVCKRLRAELGQLGYSVFSGANHSTHVTWI